MLGIKREIGSSRQAGLTRSPGRTHGSRRPSSRVSGRTRARRSSPKSMRCCAIRCGASSRKRSSRSATPGRQQGFVPRDVLRRMGALGFFGIRYPEVYGGSDMDTLGSVVLRRRARPLDLFRRRHHRAGSYRHGFGACLQRRQRGAEVALDAQDRQRRSDLRGRRDRARCRIRREGHPDDRAARPAKAMCSTAPRCSSPTACMPISIASPPRPARSTAAARR